MKKLAIFTLARNETVFLPIWLRYYARATPDLYVLDHESTETVATDVPFSCVPVANDLTDDAGWMLKTVETFQRKLLREYETVIYAEADEFLIPSGGSSLSHYLSAHPYPDVITATGWDICDPGTVPPLDPRCPLRDRNWKHNARYDKTLIARRPLSWEVGFHRTVDAPPLADPVLWLFHLHYACRETAWHRLCSRMFDKPPAPGDWGFQNKYRERAAFDENFNDAIRGAVPLSLTTETML